MFAALRDIIPSIRKAVHEDTKVLIDKYKNEIEEIMKQVYFKIFFLLHFIYFISFLVYP